MKFRRSAKIVLLIELIILNLILRFPITFHEEGVDSFTIHLLANSISNYGYAKWIIHPASIIGLYPLSYPSGCPILLSGVSQCSGINMEFTIFVVATIMFGTLGIFSAYLLAKELFGSDLVAFLCAFIFSISPLFISYTHWNVTARGMFITFLPLFIWGLVKFANSLKLRYTIPIFLFLLLLITTHRIFVLIPLVLVVFAFGILDVKFGIHGRPINAPYVTKLFVLLFLFLCLFVIQFTGKGLQEPSSEYSVSSLFQGSSPIVMLLNIGVNYATGISPLLIFIPVGLAALFRKGAKEAGAERFLLLALLLITLIITNRQYGRTFSLIFISLLIAYSLFMIIEKIERQKKIVCSFLILVLLVATAFSAWIPMYRGSSSGSSNVPFCMAEYTCNLGLFMGNHTANNVKTISNDERIGLRVSAVSGTSYNFPAGFALLMCDIVSKEQLRVEQVTMAQLIVNPETLWRLHDWSEPGFYYTARHRTALERYPNGEYEKSIFKIYGFKYLIEREGSRSYRSLVERTRKKAYKTYDNGFEKLWYFDDISMQDE